MDIWSRDKRSEIMSKIRGKNTKPELTLRMHLFKHGFRYRIHKKDLPGKPDIVLLKYKTVIFVNGCFWHQHKDCKEGRIPSSKSDYWIVKLSRNVIRDECNISILKKEGWKVITIWECDIEKRLDDTIRKLVRDIREK
jgi:DNA mismatch endonuclease (patch repair protein)